MISRDYIYCDLPVSLVSDLFFSVDLWVWPQTLVPSDLRLCRQINVLRPALPSLKFTAWFESWICVYKTWILHELRHRSLHENSLGTKLFRTISKQLSSLCACFLIHFMRLQETNYLDGSPRQIKLHSLYSFIMFRKNSLVLVCCLPRSWFFYGDRGDFVFLGKDRIDLCSSS